MEEIVAEEADHHKGTSSNVLDSSILVVLVEYAEIVGKARRENVLPDG